MPAFSRTENLLVCRYNQQGFADPNGTRILPKWATTRESLSVALPFFSVELQIQEKKVLEENIFFKTVSMLREIKQKEGLNEQQTLDYIVEKTTLDRLVVKTILKRTAQNTDLFTGIINRGTESKPYYLIYDPIGKEFLMPCIPADDYKKFMTVEVGSVKPNTKRHDLRFSLQMAEHSERALLLGFDYSTTSWDQFSILASPVSVPAKVLEEIKENVEKIKKDGHVEVKEVGNWNPILFVCTCCIDQDDLSSISVHSVVSDGYSRYLFELIRDTANRNPVVNQELLSALKRLEEQRQFHLNNASLFIDEQRDAQIWLISRYPGLKQYDDVRKKVSIFIARFPKDDQNNKDAAFSQSLDWNDSQREDITRDFHTAMESVFEIAVRKCYPSHSDEKVKDAFSVLKPSRKNYTDYFVPMAQEIGFTDIKLCTKFFDTSSIRANDVKAILADANPKNQSTQRRKQFGLSELIVAMMIEANADETHPFRKIAPKCPNLFEAMKSSKTRRDRITHNDEEKLPIPSVDELFRMRALLEICIELLAKRSGKQEEIQAEEALQVQYANGQYAAKVKADEQVKPLVFLSSLEGTRDAVWSVSYRFHFQDPLYFSECYNLMDGLLLELINRFDCPTGEIVLEQVFAGKTDGSDWATVQQIFEKYGCDYLKDLPAPSTADLLRDKRQIKKWSMRNKLAVVFVTFDKDQPEILKKTISLFPDIVLVTDEIHKGRGHNNNTDFSASEDGYQKFNTHLLGCCEAVAKMILEVE